VIAEFLKMSSAKIVVIFQIAVLLIFAFAFTSCIQAPVPSVEELEKIQMPLFNDQSSSAISSPTLNYNLTGSCDKAAYVTEYSYDQSVWTEVECVDGQFSISINLSGGYKVVYARSKSKFSYTEVAKALINFLLPPTSSLISSVASSRSDNTDASGAGTQNALTDFEQETLTDGVSKKLDTGVPRIVYEN